MRMWTSLALFGLLCIASAASGGAQEVRAVLTIPDQDLLPGVPFEMWIEVENESSRPIALGLCGDMLVQPEDAESFEISFRNPEGPRYPVLLPEREFGGAGVQRLLLAPRQKQVLTAPLTDDLRQPMYFADRRISAPGAYRIAFRLNDCRSKASLQNDRGALEKTMTVMTNECQIVRRTATAADAAAWEMLKQARKSGWVANAWGATPAAIQEILANHRDSNYYPYAVAASSFGTTPDRRFQLLSDALSRFPATPVRELLLQQMLAIVAASCGLTGPQADACAKAREALEASRRPTTRVRAYGREDVTAPPPCPEGYLCND